MATTAIRITARITQPTIHHGDIGASITRGLISVTGPIGVIAERITLGRIGATAAPITEVIGELTGIASAIAAHMVVGGKEP